MRRLRPRYPRHTNPETFSESARALSHRRAALGEQRLGFESLRRLHAGGPDPWVQRLFGEFAIPRCQFPQLLGGAHCSMPLDRTGRLRLARFVFRAIDINQPDRLIRPRYSSHRDSRYGRIKGRGRLCPGCPGTGAPRPAPFPWRDLCRRHDRRQLCNRRKADDPWIAIHDRAFAWFGLFGLDVRVVADVHLRNPGRYHQRRLCGTPAVRVDLAQRICEQAKPDPIHRDVAVIIDEIAPRIIESPHSGNEGNDPADL